MSVNSGEIEGKLRNQTSQSEETFLDRATSKSVFGLGKTTPTPNNQPPLIIPIL